MSNQRGFIAPIIVFAIVTGILLAGILIYSHKPTTPQKVSQAQAHTTALGVTLSPTSFQAKDFTQFLSQAAKSGQVISWTGTSDQLSDTSSAAYVLCNLSTSHHFQPVIITDWKNPDDLVRLVTSCQPTYVGIGNEVNRLSSADYHTLVAIFPTIVKRIHLASPSTKVFPVFQYEQLVGLRGGLFGGTNNLDITDWAELSDFPQADAIGFTTYPGLMYHRPEEMPTTYYSDISQHTQKPVLFSEIGWASSAMTEGWDSNPQMQSDFIRRFFTLTFSLHPSIAIWSFLYDQPVQQPFSTMGLLDQQSKAKPGLSVWQSSQ